MLTRNDDWIIWLTPQAGEVLLGLLPSSPGPASPVAGNRRFCVLGKLEGPDRSDVGVWIDVDFVQELTVPDNTTVKTWEVNPRSCLIRWSDIRYAQRGERSEKGKIGFMPMNSK